MSHERLLKLSAAECLALLGNRHLGRIALVESDHPVILPVNYVLDEAAIVFRTAPGTKLDAAALGMPVAFEIDGIDASDRTGWSVLVRGRAEHVTDPATLERLRRLPLMPWAPGAKPHYVRIGTEKMSGRRISVADLPSTWWG